MSPYTVPPVEQFQEPLSSMPADETRWRYDIDWAMVGFWGAYLSLLLLATLAGWRLL